MRTHNKKISLRLLMLIGALCCLFQATTSLFTASVEGSPVGRENYFLKQNNQFVEATQIKAASLDSVKLLDAYRQNLKLLREEYGGSRDLPDVRFFLFGMGPRRKMIYMDGVLKDSLSGEVVRQWDVATETIFPPAYSVILKTKSGQSVKISEDETGVWLEEGKRRSIISQSSSINLPSFSEYKYGPVLRVLHQEILINIINNQSGIPNYFVYSKPWYRDGAMMCMVLKETGNINLVRNWILGLRDPFDRNNAGEAEADNLGQALYMVSLVSNQSHPLVKTILDLLPKYKEGTHIKGRSDFAEHPVYQTKWLKYSLNALKLNDPYEIPLVKDSYSPLFWWAYQDAYVKGEGFNKESTQNWPYLVWAEDHFHGEKRGLVGNRDYPLSWEAHASQANYNGMSVLSQAYVDQKLSVPHTWHASEMFLYLLKSKSNN